MFTEFNLLDYYIGVIRQDHTVMQVLDTITLALMEDSITSSDIYALKKAAALKISSIVINNYENHIFKRY